MAEPGWYTDSNGDNRYWDGTNWTEHVQPATGAPAPAYQVGPVQPAAAKTNTMAILALVGALIMAPVGIILGIISLKQIKQTGEGGRGLAVAGVAVGSVFTVIGAIGFLMAIILPAMMLTAVSTLPDDTFDSSITQEWDSSLDPSEGTGSLGVGDPLRATEVLGDLSSGVLALVSIGEGLPATSNDLNKALSGPLMSGEGVKLCYKDDGMSVTLMGLFNGQLYYWDPADYSAVEVEGINYLPSCVQTDYPVEGPELYQE